MPNRLDLMNLICDDCLLECPDAIYAELCPLVQSSASTVIKDEN